MHNDIDRHEFEKWAELNIGWKDVDLQRCNDDPDCYILDVTQHAWMVWQAALIHQSWSGMEMPSANDGEPSKEFKAAWQNGLPFNSPEARWCWVGWSQAMKQSYGSGEAVGEILHDYNGIRIKWYEPPKYGRFKSGEKIYTHPSASVPDPDIQLIAERDYWEEKATELAEDIGKYFGVEMGEHSSANCPVQNAIDAVFNAAPQPVGDGWVRHHDDGSILGYSQHYGKWLLLRYGNDHPMNSPKPPEGGSNNE